MIHRETFAWHNASKLLHLKIWSDSLNNGRQQYVRAKLRWHRNDDSSRRRVTIARLVGSWTAATSQFYIVCFRNEFRCNRRLANNARCALQFRHIGAWLLSRVASLVVPRRAWKQSHIRLIADGTVVDASGHAHVNREKLVAYYESLGFHVADRSEADDIVMQSNVATTMRRISRLLLL